MQPAASVAGKPVGGEGRSGLQAGIFAATTELLEQEERVSQLETSAMRLDEYFTQLNNISTQATLLLGFVLGIACNDGVLTAIGDTTGKMCMYKSVPHYFVIVLLMSATCGSLCLSLLVIMGCQDVIQRGQKAYLHVGWLAAVYRVRECVSTLLRWFFWSLILFLIAVNLLLWTFLGLPHYALVDGGSELRACLDADHGDDELHRQEVQGSILTALMTLEFCVAVVYGGLKFKSWSHSTECDAIDSELLLLLRQEEQAHINWRRKEREVARNFKADVLSVAPDHVADPAVVGVHVREESGASAEALREATKARELWEVALRRLELGRAVSHTHRHARQRTFKQMELEAKTRVRMEVAAEVARRGGAGKRNHTSALSRYMHHHEEELRRTVTTVASEALAEAERPLGIPGAGRI